MQLSEIQRDPETALHAMERYVNEGSPSGFTHLFRSSPETDPWGGAESFPLYACRGPREWYRDYGDLSAARYTLGLLEDALLIHPDVVNVFRPAWLSDARLSVTRTHALAVPTSTSRTVQLLGSCFADYVKLHYPAVLGRVRRELPWHKAVAGPEICAEVLKRMGDLLPRSFGLLHEAGTRVLVTPGGDEVGMVWRKGAPVCANRVAYMIPFFALFSMDRRSPGDPLLLVQILDKHARLPLDFLVESVLGPVIDCYSALVTRLGYQPECNAQNLLLGVDDLLRPTAIIFRDMGRVEKDLSLREQLGLRTDFASAPYKCISRGDQLYRVRHSFAFDFKLSHYILLPIEDVLCKVYGVARERVRMAFRERAHSFIESVSRDYFPEDGYWYRHEKRLLTEDRAYVSERAPLYR